jgi:hypothetical protein
VINAYGRACNYLAVGRMKRLLAFIVEPMRPRDLKPRLAWLFIGYLRTCHSSGRSRELATALALVLQIGGLKT